MSNNQPNVELRSVHSLLNLKFFIPSYQRGYRWGKTQIEDLLSDIWEYEKRVTSESTKVAGDYYCLQPLVVKFRPKTNDWEVIDGQQRLTTIHIIMKCLEPQLKSIELGYFQISYETRPEINNKFLETLDDQYRNENIDIFHMANAADTIQEWFQKQGIFGVTKLKWLQRLLENNNGNTRFIWYEIPSHHDPIEAFTRLNMGKIPLTNAELVRALFLGKSFNTEQFDHDSTQLRIAENWNIIEHQLHRSEFWYFVHNNHNAPTSRIEFIFDQITQRYLSSLDDHSKPSWTEDQNRIFHYFYNQFNPTEQPQTNPKSSEHKEKLWKDIRDFALTLDEWFNNRSLYHLVGFLQNQGEHEIHKLHAESLKLHKSEFQHYLKKLIFKAVFKSELSSDNTAQSIITDFIQNVTYSNSNKQQLRNLLLLFNIATLELNDDFSIRFPFNSYKIQKWDIEHINAVASKPSRLEDQRAWFSKIIEFHQQNDNFANEIENHKEAQEQFANSIILQDPQFGFKSTVRGFNININTIIDSNQFTNFFDAFYSIITSIFFSSEQSSNLDGIGNLTLLDQSTNRGYQNAPYPLKRKIILDTAQKGTYVPLCTRNVFLKAYSSKLNNMLMWLDTDQSDYEAEIIDTLNKFFHVS
jgi:hypothetical protein